MKKTLILLLLFVSSNISAFQYYLTVCSIFRDDAPYLKEWIEFHIDQGVEHFYLYNNLSKDNYKEVLQPFVDKGIVTLTEWPYEHDNEAGWQKIQCNSYMDCVDKIRDVSDWCAFIDTDEFLFSPTRDLKNTLKRYKKYSGVVVNWVLYGTSNVKKVPIGEKITQHLCWRSDLKYIENRICKTVARPRFIKASNSSHCFFYLKGHAVNERKKEIKNAINKNISVKYLRINHYRTRDEDFFYNVKMARSKNWANQERFNSLCVLNKVYDAILK